MGTTLEINGIHQGGTSASCLAKHNNQFIENGDEEILEKTQLCLGMVIETSPSVLCIPYDYKVEDTLNVQDQLY